MCGVFLLKSNKDLVKIQLPFFPSLIIIPSRHNNDCIIFYFINKAVFFRNAPAPFPF